MKKILILASCGFIFTACNNNPSKPSATAAEKTAAGITTDTTAENTPKSKTVKDPVCDMEEADIKFTDYSVYQKDTVWFCSPHCKKVFDKNPEKYASKIKA